MVLSYLAGLFYGMSNLAGLFVSKTLFANNYK